MNTATALTRALIALPAAALVATPALLGGAATAAGHGSSHPNSHAAPHGAHAHHAEHADHADHSGAPASSQGQQHRDARPTRVPRHPHPTHPAHPAQPAQSVGSGRGSSGDPAGNNGTVKVAPLGDLDGIPNNTSHPGCTFEIQWYGFDAGSDVVSTVTFAMQAPTQDVGLSVDGPSQVPVGEDAASGAGTDTGLDATASYTLAFDGAPQVKQGYHVRLTVATPRSQGNDTKTKVFWVAPCTEAAGPTEAATGSTGDTGSAGDTGSTGSSADESGAVAGISATATPQGRVAAGPLAAGDVAPSSQVLARPSAGGTVPTGVDAGAGGHTVSDVVTSPPAILLLGAVLLTGLAVPLLRRRRA